MFRRAAVALLLPLSCVPSMVRSRSGLVRRDDLFLQTKYTFQDGQDHRLPYDPDAPIAKQVEQSFASSLEHLGVATIDRMND